ncbi:nuclear transport factor 2 family protein [Streptomyces sp. NBC_00083]|uniref:nuclear transport factor 2 family protein n=1 Tax=Streptomyces sp. NBC_00083 TaxID=2975647 RepID=UPI002256E721|nr:nuclear transport factor 2 family protein [Streptomyces sp. NBC_00083]MCX5384460.1 nuclear transport factor 2 family protein [Streptomyces sp. NBC_00083]
MTRTGIAAALNDLLFNRGITLDEAAERHFAPDYRQRTDGEWADRAEFLDHIGHLRGIVADGHVEVHDELYDGDKYADRHTCHVTKKDGSSVTMEVYVFADFSADGRFRRIEETTLMLRGSEADRDLGSAR